MMSRKSVFRVLFTASLVLTSGEFIAAASTSSPEPTLGESVYKSVSEAVFLVEVLAEGGESSSLGTAFLVANQQLVTNYHVIEGGTPHLRIGALRLECQVEKVDPSNDLALLRVPGSISAKPLVLSPSEPSAGSTIFAVGNPAGLERTITQGLISGRRDIEGKSLLQISAAISPGSSGGPVVNPKGEVVGVAVGYLKDGQNLNFAIPTKAVIELLEGDSRPAPDFRTLLHEAEKLDQKLTNLKVSDPEWDLIFQEVESALRAAKNRASGLEDLLVVADAAERLFRTEAAIEAARAALSVSPKSDLRAHRVLARCLPRSLWFLETTEKERILAEALSHAQLIVDRSPKVTAEDLFNLAFVLEKISDRSADAYLKYQQALAVAHAAQEEQLQRYFRGLFRTSKDLKQAKSWLKELVDRGDARAFDWTRLAVRLKGEQEYGQAGDAWSKAAQLEETSEYLCEAGSNYWLADRLDDALTSYRRCVEVGTSESDVEERLGSAYSDMSAILFHRGVYDQSISHAKQALSLTPEDPWPYYNLSLSLNALGRHGEAAIAAESAIRLSDGRYSDMHFALGAAYFESGTWDRALLAFQKAAELDQSNWAAAYNVALCFGRQRFYLDAAKWYEEVLKRKPDHPEREDILKRIRTLRE